jgi:Cullin family/Cullin protein neddylation domain
VVKNLRTTPRVDPQQYFERVWKQQDSALSASFNDEKIPYSLEELYKGAENVCRQGKAPELYKRLRQKCKEYLEGQITENLKQTASRSETDVAVLKAFVEAWSRWQRQLLTIRQIFYYMDQTYLLRSMENPTLTDTGLILFGQKVFADEILKQKVMKGVVDLIDFDRRGHISEDDSSVLRRSIDTLHELSIYTSDFEPTFNESSNRYFRTWRESEAEKSDLAHYASVCTNLLEKEMTRCDVLMLDRSTRVQMSALFDEIFVEERVELLTEQDSVLDLLEAQKYAELRQVWTLLQRKGHGEKLGPTFDKFILDEGTAIVFDEKREADMVLNLLDFKKSLDHFLRFSFLNNDNMGNGYHKSFEQFINKTKKTQANWDTDNAKPGEMIAKHVDLLLKGGVKAIPRFAAAKSDPSKPQEEHDFDDAPADEDAEINMHLSNALDLFRFVQGKAVFEAFYKKDLARRLLMGRSASHDAERNMLTRLKNECGAGFTHNLESMFKDIDLTRDEMASYNQLLDDRGGRKAGPDLHVSVLSAASWPTYPDVPINIPPAISKVMSEFETYYKTKHNGRMLTWRNALAHCQLKAKFAKGNKDLVVSGFQAVVLLLFNDTPAGGSLSYNDIQAASGLSDAELRRTLQSLACAKYRVLTKDPKGREVNNTDTFTINENFSDPKMRIKINQIQLKETKEENKETHQRVAQDRVFETQAAIVRIMKSKKTITHNELIIDVINATKTRGVLDQVDIKKNIEK